MLVNATSIDFVICAAPTTTAERPQTTVLVFSGLLAVELRGHRDDRELLRLVGGSQRCDPRHPFAGQG
jgi:hypothetical protein